MSNVLYVNQNICSCFYNTVSVTGQLDLILVWSVAACSHSKGMISHQCLKINTNTVPFSDDIVPPLSY